MNRTYMQVQGDQIVGLLTIPERDYVYLTMKGMCLVAGEANPATHYMPAGVLTARPQHAATLTGTVLSGLPVPCTVRIQGQSASSHPVAEPSVELAFDQPGTYQVTVVAWPYQDKVFTYENPA